MQLMQINSKVFLVLLLDIIPVTQPFFKKKKKTWQNGCHTEDH